MKKIYLLILLSVVFFSCKKDDETPVPSRYTNPSVVFSLWGTGVGKTITVTFILYDTTPQSNVVKVFNKTIVYSTTHTQYNPMYVVLDVTGIPESGSYRQTPSIYLDNYKWERAVCEKTGELTVSSSSYLAPSVTNINLIGSCDYEIYP